MEQLNKNFDNIFVIALKDSVREGRISKRFDGLNYEFFYGVDGTKVDKQYYENKGSKLTYGQLGCSLSHINLYKKIVDENIEIALILEDDCVFNDNIEKFENYYSELPKDWDVVYIGYLPMSNIHQSNVKNLFYKVCEKKKLIKDVCGTHSMIIKKDFAEKMYQFNKNAVYTADGAFTVYLKEKGGNMYAFVPSMASQDGMECLSVNVDRKMIELTGSHVKYMEKK